MLQASLFRRSLSTAPRYPLVARGLWRLAIVGASTGIWVFSHLGIGAAQGHTFAGLKAAQRAGFVAMTLWLVGLIGLTTLSWCAPFVRRQAKKAALLCTLLTLSGMPWVFVCAMTAPLFGVVNFWPSASFGGAVGFVIWLKLLATSKLELPLPTTRDPLQAK